ncbi:hypothetical protein BGZ83_006275 [Gryganskiella cystojenkinii]|nr:hypothetical protein BGZ83_006275 [Gryganskiella cystojenkinii]
MTNNLIKMLRVDSGTSLPKLFEAIMTKVGNEISVPASAATYKLTGEESGLIARTFRSVLKQNSSLLSIYAQTQLKAEMASSFCQRHRREDLESLREMNEDHFDIRSGKGRLVASTDENRIASLRDLMARNSASNALELFAVYDHTALLPLAEYVILFEDGTYFCSCARLQGKGFVCRHFFHLMQDDGRFQYKIDLIPARWHREEAQKTTEATDPLLPQPSIPASTSTAASDAVVDPAGADTSQSQSAVGHDATSGFYAPEPIVTPTRREKIKKSRYAKLVGAAKTLVDDVSAPGISDQDFQREPPQVCRLILHQTKSRLIKNLLTKNYRSRNHRFKNH